MSPSAGPKRGAAAQPGDQVLRIERWPSSPWAVARLGLQAPATACDALQPQARRVAVGHGLSRPLDLERPAVAIAWIGTEGTLRTAVILDDEVANQDAVVIAARRQRQGQGLPALAIAAAALINKAQARASKAVPAPDHLGRLDVRATQGACERPGLHQLGTSQGALGAEPDAQLTGILGHPRTRRWLGAGRVQKRSGQKRDPPRPRQARGRCVVEGGPDVSS
jgi:hypothetical protein